MEHYLKTLENTAKRRWDKPAVCNFEGESFTYGQMSADIERFHIFFEKIGIRECDHIALCAHNSARWAVSFLAISSYNAVVVPLLSEFTPESICNLVDHSESTVLFTNSDIWSKLDITMMPKIRTAVSVNDFSLLYSADDSISAAFESVPSEFENRHPMGFNRESLHFRIGSQEDVAVINYTSGTTSAPKGVILKAKCFSAMFEYSAPRAPINNDEGIVSMLPMGHIYGLMFEFLYPLGYGATVYYLGKTPSPTLLLKAMGKVHPFMIATVPLVMEKIYKSSVKPALSKFPVNLLSSIPVVRRLIYRKIGKKLFQAFGGNVRHIIMGGAAINPAVELAFRRMGLPYCIGYGMTEAAPLLAYEDWRRYKMGSCGKAVTCADVRIDSEDPAHIAGEIQAKGTNICSGYFNNPEASANAFTADGYLHTGDLGIIDKDGNIFIKGRSKSMILSSSGQNIYPEEVEAVINKQQYVSESVVVDRNGKLVALIVLDKDAIRLARLDEEAEADIPESARVNSNRELPSYSRITKIEVMLKPFEKTPKMSIKRYLYK